MSHWLHRGLTEAGLDTVLMETRQVTGARKAMRHGMIALVMLDASRLCIAPSARLGHAECYLSGVEAVSARMACG